METESLVLIRNSEQSLFKDCRYAWWLAYVRKKTSKRPRAALTLGTLVHAALEIYYPPGIRRGPHPAKTIAALWEDYLAAGGEPMFLKDDPDSPESDRVPLIDLGVEMMKNYVDKYGKDDRYKVVSSEQSFQVDVSHPKTGKYLFTFVGQIDGVWYDRQNKVFLFAEHKTGAGLGPFGAPVSLDEQSGTYWGFAPDWLVAKGIIKSPSQLEGVLFNRLRKGFKDTRPMDDQGHYLNLPKKPELLAACEVRGLDTKGTNATLTERLLQSGFSQRELDLLGEVSKRQAEDLFKRELVIRGDFERADMQERIRMEAYEMDLVKKGKLGVYKNPGRHCGWCGFRVACEVHNTGDDVEAVLKYEYKDWDPYESHREDIMMSEEEV